MDFIEDATKPQQESVGVPEPDYSDSGEEDIPTTNAPSQTITNDLDLSSVQERQEEISTDNIAQLSSVKGDSEYHIPEPDYLEVDNQIQTNHDTTDLNNLKSGMKTGSPPSDICLVATDEAALIQPKKLVNPCLISKDHKALRRELMLNQKIGKKPTEKPELIKVMNERQEKEKKKEMEEYLKSKRTSLDIRLEEQAQKLVQAEKQHEDVARTKSGPETEFFKIHSKISKTKSDS